MIQCQRLQAFVRGRVQGVGFRYFVQREAHALGLTGWVRNCEDGRSVEVVAEGDHASLQRLEARLREGPAFSVVSEVEVSWSVAQRVYSNFGVRH